MDDLILDFSRKNNADTIKKLATPATYSETTTLTVTGTDELNIADILSNMPTSTAPQRPVPATDTVENKNTTKNKRVLPEPEYIIDDLAHVTGEELMAIVGKRVLVRGSNKVKGTVEIVESGGAITSFFIKGNRDQNTFLALYYSTQKDGINFSEAQINSGSYSILVYND